MKSLKLAFNRLKIPPIGEWGGSKKKKRTCFKAEIDITKISATHPSKYIPARGCTRYISKHNSLVSWFWFPAKSACIMSQIKTILTGSESGHLFNYFAIWEINVFSLHSQVRAINFFRDVSRQTIGFIMAMYCIK